TGWPDAALAVAIALALPIVDALAIARPAQIVSLIRAAIATEASKFDDHRQDDAGVLPDASDRRAPPLARTPTTTRLPAPRHHAALRRLVARRLGDRLVRRLALH